MVSIARIEATFGLYWNKITLTASIGRSEPKNCMATRLEKAIQPFQYMQFLDTIKDRSYSSTIYRL